MIDIFKTRTMLKVIENAPPLRTFLRDTFFKNSETFDTPHVDVDICKSKRRLAPFVSPRVSGKNIDRQGFRTETYSPALVGPQIITNADHVMNRTPGESVYGGITPLERAARLLAKDLVELENMITRREEWMCAQMLTTGKVVMKGDDVDDVIDFEFTNTEALTGVNAWDNPASDPIKDIKRWRTEIEKSSGVSPNYLLVSSDVAEMLVDHPKIQSLFNIWNYQMGQMAPTFGSSNGVNYVGRLSSAGVEVYYYNEWFVDEDDSNQLKPLIPPKTAILVSDNAGYGLNYGSIYRPGVGLFEGTRAPYSWIENDPPSRFLVIHSKPLPIVKDVDSWFVATVA